MMKHIKYEIKPIPSRKTPGTAATKNKNNLFEYRPTNLEFKIKNR